MSRKHLLLLLPYEIRQLIWELALPPRIVHVLKDSKTYCAVADQDTCSIGEFKRHQTLAWDLSCLCCIAADLHRWTTACRQIYNETRRLQFERTTVSFTSVEALYRLLPLPAYTFEQLYGIYFYLGPAKYGHESDMHKIEEIFLTLSQKATNLRDLNLTVSYYGGAETDKVLLSTQAIRGILNFRNLKSFHLRMGKLPPGPVGPAYDPKLVAAIHHRLEISEMVLGNYVCPQQYHGCHRKVEHPTVKVIMEQCSKKIDCIDDDNDIHHRDT